MGLEIPPLRMKTLLESKRLKSRIVVRRLAVGGRDAGSAGATPCGAHAERGGSCARRGCTGCKRGGARDAHWVYARGREECKVWCV